MSELEPLDSLEPAAETSAVIFEPDHDEIRENFENENERKAKSEIDRGIEAFCSAGRLRRRGSPPYITGRIRAESCCS